MEAEAAALADGRQHLQPAAGTAQRLPQVFQVGANLFFRDADDGRDVPGALRFPAQGGFDLPANGSRALRRHRRLFPIAGAFFHSSSPWLRRKDSPPQSGHLGTMIFFSR